MNDSSVYPPAAIEEGFSSGENAACFTADGPGLQGRPHESVSGRRTAISASRVLVAMGNVFFRYRNILFPLVFCGLAFGTRPVLAGGDRRLDALLDAAGIAIGSAGQLLRVLVIGFAYVKRGGKDKRVYADVLVQEGFFAHCRNPLYLGNILIAIGFAVIHNGIWLYTVGIPFFLLAYVSITAAEEDYLYRNFGREYEDYCKRVPRFAISFKGLSETLGGMRYDWRKTLRKEYGTTFVFVTSVLALLGWEGAASAGFETARPQLTVLMLAWIPVVLTYCGIRIAKKAGVLGTG